MKRCGCSRLGLSWSERVSKHGLRRSTSKIDNQLDRTCCTHASLIQKANGLVLMESTVGQLSRDGAEVVADRAYTGPWNINQSLVYVVLRLCISGAVSGTAIDVGSRCFFRALPLGMVEVQPREVFSRYRKQRVSVSLGILRSCKDQKNIGVAISLE